MDNNVSKLKYYQYSRNHEQFNEEFEGTISFYSSGFVNPRNPIHLCTPLLRNSRKKTTIEHETYISTFAQKKKKQARLPRAHGNCQWPQGISKPQKKRPQETYRF